MKGRKSIPPTRLQMKAQIQSFLTPVIAGREISNYLANQERISGGGVSLSAAFPFLRVCRSSCQAGGSHWNCSWHCLYWETTTPHQELQFGQGNTGGDCTKAWGVWRFFYLASCLIFFFFLDKMRLINAGSRWWNTQQQEMELISCCFLLLGHSPEIWGTFKSPPRGWGPFRRQCRG